MRFLLPFPVGSIVGIVGVEMGQDYKHISMELVVVVVEVHLHRLPVPAVVLHELVLGVAVGIVIWGLVGSFPAWQVVLGYLQIVL